MPPSWHAGKKRKNRARIRIQKKEQESHSQLTEPRLRPSLKSQPNLVFFNSFDRGFCLKSNVKHTGREVNIAITFKWRSLLL